MGRKQLVITCSSCESPLRSDAPFCEACGRPAPWASHDERIAWEVRQWRASKAREPETSGRMLLVRTDEGYVPVPDRPTDYIWDQPLHPERDATVRMDSHADARPAPARTVLEEEPVHVLTEVLSTPAPPAVEPQAAPADPTVESDVREISTALVVQPHPEVAGVGISKRAVAVAVALVIGLPFGGKLVGLVKGSPAGRNVAATAGGPVEVLPTPLVGRTGFVQVSADAARYAVVVNNANKGLVARGVTVTITFLDRSGRLLGTQLERIPAVPAGATVAVAGESGVAGTVASMQSRFAVGAFVAGFKDRIPTVRDVRFSRNGGAVVVRATIAGGRARGVRVVVVHFDRSGRVVGGDFTYVDLPSSQVATAVISTANAPRVARVKVFVLPAR